MMRMLEMSTNSLYMLVLEMGVHFGGFDEWNVHFVGGHENYFHMEL